MNVVINIFQGYMDSCKVSDSSSRIMKYLLTGQDFITSDNELAIDSYSEFIQFKSAEGDITCYIPNGLYYGRRSDKYRYVVSVFDNWKLKEEEVKVFSNRKTAWNYYDSLRKKSRQYKEIIEADGDKDNFLDDDVYAVFIEKAEYFK